MSDDEAEQLMLWVASLCWELSTEETPMHKIRGKEETLLRAFKDGVSPTEEWILDML